MAEKGALVKRPWEIKGVSCLAAAIFLFLCLVSYHPHDPSFTHFVSGEVESHNLIGSFGSYTADMLVRAFGLGAFFLPVALFISAFRFFRMPSFEISLASAGGFGCFLLSFSGLTALLFNRIRVYDEMFRAGGILGYGIQTYLNYYFNVAGSYLLVLLVLVLSLMMTMDLSL
ncbi:MAG: DNA translocase FtsK 4TM domain-containing protein, partial [Syntrophales bacterium]|nr:DNA translocase FtsK 4TM domain-containing protein [Syntrophales bacterium]